MDSPEGQQSIAVRDDLWKLLEDVQLDAKQRKLIWPDRERLDLKQSIQRVQKKYPDFPRDEVEEFLLDWIDMGYDPQNYSQAQLDELDSLTERWVADHLRKAKASKKQERTRHS
jgi:glycerol-3-phosphate cytidylyltransferase-like family protein